MSQAKAGLRRALARTLASRNEPRRHAWVQAQLAALPPGARLLDAGAGEQRYRRFAAHLDYVSQDFCQYDGKGDGSALQTGAWDVARTDLVCDIAAIPEPDGAFAAILCTEVLEHVPDPVAALRELARLLKPGGILILTAPFASLTHFAPYHYCSGFNRYFYEYWLPRLGLDIEILEANGDFMDFLGQELLRVRKLMGDYGAVRRLLLSAAAVAAAMSLRFLSSRRATAPELLCFGYHVRARRGTGDAAMHGSES